MNQWKEPRWSQFIDFVATFLPLAIYGGMLAVVLYWPTHPQVFCK